MLLELASHFHPNRTTTSLLTLIWKEKQLFTGIYSAEDASKPNISRHSFLFLFCCVLNIHFLTYIIYKGPCKSLNAWNECEKRQVCFAEQSLAMLVKRFKDLWKPTSQFIPHFLSLWNPLSFYWPQSPRKIGKQISYRQKLPQTLSWPGYLAATIWKQIKPIFLKTHSLKENDRVLDPQSWSNPD